MNSVKVILEGDKCWPDLEEKIESGNLIHLPDPQMQIAALSKGMTSGNPSVSIRIELPDGKTVLAETSMKLFLGIADIFRQKYAQELE